MNILNVIQLCAYAVAFISIPFLLFNVIKFNYPTKQSPNPFPTKSLAFFLIPIFVVIATGIFVTVEIDNEVSNFFEQLPDNYTVYVNKKPVPNGDQIVSTLKTASRQLGHHSHPTDRISLDIKSQKGNLSLELRRDSEIPQEYWVYYYKYGVGWHTDIGKITTPIFDKY